MEVISALVQPCVTISIGGSLLSANHLFALLSCVKGGPHQLGLLQQIIFPPQHSYRQPHSQDLCPEKFPMSCPGAVPSWHA